MIDTIATAGGFVFIAYVMGQVVQGNLDRRKRIERMDAEMRLLMREHKPSALVHQSNVIGMAAWKNSRAQGVGTLRG
jgi:hypothetical protein